MVVQYNLVYCWDFHKSQRDFFFLGGGKRESQADKQPPPSKKHIHDLIFHRLEEKQKTPWFCQGVLGCSFTDLGDLAAFGGSLLGLVIFVYPGSASGGGWGLGGLGDAIFSGRSMVRMTQIQTCGNLVGISLIIVHFLGWCHIS